MTDFISERAADPPRTPNLALPCRNGKEIAVGSRTTRCSKTIDGTGGVGGYTVLSFDGVFDGMALQYDIRRCRGGGEVV